MRYISLATWRDLSDGHLYAEGDLFPFDGREITPERLYELEGGNRAGLTVIQAVNYGEPEDRKEEDQEDPEVTAETDPEPEPEPEQAKPKQRTAKKPANKK